MLSMGQHGLWDEQQKVAKLQEKKPVLMRLAESIPWASFRPLLDKGYSQGRKSNAGRKRIDPLILFKMLVLQQLFPPLPGKLTPLFWIHFFHQGA